MRRLRAGLRGEPQCHEEKLKEETNHELKSHHQFSLFSVSTDATDGGYGPVKKHSTLQSAFIKVGESVLPGVGGSSGEATATTRK